MTSILNLNRRKKLVKCYTWSTSLYGAETWTVRKAELKYLESVTDHVGNEYVLQSKTGISYTQ
jgi:hypothetical protein